MDSPHTKETKKVLWKQEEPFLPPLSPSNNQPDVSSSRQSSRLNSSLTLHSSLSSRSANSTQSGGSAMMKERRDELKNASSSINSETLAIAIELSNLKARRKKDERETLARILDSSDEFDSCLRRRSSTATSRPRSKTTSSRKATKTPPPTRVYTGPGAHFLDWYIPNHMTGSRALQRSASSSVSSRNKIICSPLHRPEKQEWTKRLINPKASGLRIPTAVPPRIVDYPCTWQNSFKDELKKYQMRVNSKSDSSQLKSLDLSPRKGTMQFPIDTSDNKLNGSMFATTQAPMPWFIIHPDWRTEPRITWEDLEEA